VAVTNSNFTTIAGWCQDIGQNVQDLQGHQLAPQSMECMIRGKLSGAGGVVPCLDNLESTIVGITPQLSHLAMDLNTYATNHTTDLNTYATNHIAMVAWLFANLDQAQARQDAASKALVNNINEHTALLNTLTTQVTTQSDRAASLVAKNDA
jgi:hypothetical protein